MQGYVTCKQTDKISFLSNTHSKFSNLNTIKEKINKAYTNTQIEDAVSMITSLLGNSDD